MAATLTTATGSTFYGSAADAETIAIIEAHEAQLAADEATAAAYWQLVAMLVSIVDPFATVDDYTETTVLALADAAEWVVLYGPADYLDAMADAADAVSATHGVSVDRIIAIVTDWRNA